MGVDNGVEIISKQKDGAITSPSRHTAAMCLEPQRKCVVCCMEVGGPPLAPLWGGDAPHVASILLGLGHACFLLAGASDS